MNRTVIHHRTNKVCMCCNTAAKRLARKCKTCGVPAIWRAPTCEEIQAYEANRARMETVLNELLAMADAE
jgi:predicted amidophosphoribosyltransferase